PFIPVNNLELDPFDENSFYYDLNYRFKVPFSLSTGRHTVRMFPARSFGESIKGDRAFASSFFYVGSDRGGNDADLSLPYLTYNEPSAQMYLVEDKPVLLDFYISNTELSSDGYKVRLSVDGTVHRTIT